MEGEEGTPKYANGAKRFGGSDILPRLSRLEAAPTRSAHCHS
jgi:hypothetical protein